MRDKVESVLWVGGEGGMEEELVRKAGVDFRSIPAAGVHGVGLRRLPGNIIRLARGYSASKRILREYRPHALFFTGGYVAVPLALAGRGRPSLLYVPDIEPGLAIKAISRLASRIALTTPSSRDYFPASSRMVVSGYPLRAELDGWDKSRGRAFFDLRAGLPTLLITGGSRGARSINQAVSAALSQLLEFTQIIWITGTLDWPLVEESLASLSPAQSSRLRAMPYLHEMGAALSAADLVVSRAGASCLGEYPRFGLPAILVPYPYAWRYQKVNAAWLANQGAARMIRDEQLTGSLLPVVHELLEGENGAQLNHMRAAMLGLAQLNAAEKITEELLLLAAGGGA